MNVKSKINIGQKVTCIHEVEAYYSRYCGRPKVTFRPGNIGIVVSITPKVRIIKRLPVFDGCEEFVVVDFVDGEHGNQRCSLNFCNVKIIRD